MVLEGEATLREGTRVQVEPVEASTVPTTLGQRLKRFSGAAKQLSNDMAGNHDHYLPGPLLDTPSALDFNSSMSQLLARITIDPAICHGKPVIRGLRYPVESMLEYLAAGDSIEDLLTEYPDLEREDLLACLEFAAQSLKLKSQHLVLS